MSELLKQLYILILKYEHRATVVKVQDNEYTIFVREVAHSKDGPRHKMEIVLTPGKDYAIPGSFRWP